MPAKKKSLGQHFLVDPHAIDRIVGAADATPQQVVEIGPGAGALTEPLRQRFARVALIEKDRQLVQTWQAQANDNLIVIEADAAADDWVAALPAGPWGVAANLPYNAATAILRRLLRDYERFPWLVLMFQREVAERILQAGRRRGGPLGVLTCMVYDAEHVLTLPPGAFDPPPAVESTVVRLTRRDDPLPVTDLDGVWSLLKRVFHKRRARLDTVLMRMANVPRDVVQDWFEQLAIRPDARPDHVEAWQFRKLYGYVQQQLSMSDAP